MQTPSTVFIKIADYDLSGLPETCRDPNAPGFADTLIRHVSDEYAADGMFAKVSIEQDTLIIAEDLEAKAKSDEGLDALQRGVYATGKAIFEALLFEHPNNAIVLYNLGMVYSDEGNLDKAIELLSTLIRLKPDYAHGWVALAVAYMRNNQIIEADQSAQKAVQLAPNDQYALRTAGYIASKLNEPEAAALLENAVRAAPNDPIALLALAENLMVTHKDEAIKKRLSALLTQVIDVAPGSKAAERAEEILRNLAYDKFRQTGALNPQAVEYCLHALRTFQGMSHQEVAGVALETAALGQGGLDVNNPNKTYQLRAVPGNYTGLQVVCFMYVALEQVAPGQDIGFDLKAEYEEALRMFKSSNR
ncbi:tetratricopeptide repeat protein [Methylomonas sp. LW13]|uniref:tetratricopeptide repeat protein n=1 Tax=unclassified Methylomonas TaxID=2608980 RepID=UPI00051BBE97|nr:tetratricopeptide repeat protein [Methylomonas sp. LW13]QBC28141.1 tetratricopeptide repeat protein [Methylomonas sp. LW13]